MYTPVVIPRPENLTSELTGITSCVLGLIALQVLLSDYLAVGVDFKEKLIVTFATITLLASLFNKQHVLLAVGICLLAFAIMSQWLRHGSARAAKRAE